ncbi:hypothetical protein N402_08205 [Helicobacter pylori FD423]|nr:hypothetical protein N402_08205 [Helicobacter pylori FD423]
MFSPFWIKLLILGISYIHWNTFGMYLEHYNIKAFFFFFCHFGKILSFFCFWCFLFRLVALE